MPRSPLTSETSAAHVLWAIAVHGPCTSREISNVLETDDGNIRGQLISLYRTDLIRRDRRNVDNGGKDPYEYDIKA